MQWHCRWGLVNGYGYLFTWWRGGSRCSVFRNFYTWAFFWLKFHGYTVLRTRYVSFHWNSCVIWLKISKTGWWIHQFKSKIIIFPIPVGCLFVLFEWIEWLMKGRVDERPDWNLFYVHLSNVSMSPPCDGLINQLTKLFADSYIQLGWSDDVMEVLSAVHKLHVTQFQFDHKSAIGSHSTHKKAKTSQCLASIATLCLHTNSPPFVDVRVRRKSYFLWFVGATYLRNLMCCSPMTRKLAVMVW